MILRWVGRAFITAGCLILLFLAYELVGTNVVAKQHQKALTAGLIEEWDAAAPVTAASPHPDPSSEPGPPTPEPSPQPRRKPVVGSGVAIVEIPKIDVERVVVEGIEVDDLKKGPGHFPGTALPGEQGNMVISGHRTTYGAPFYRLDELRAGDEIKLVTAAMIHRYRVTGTKIVEPDDLSVVVKTDDARLTLTTCNPRFSARQRLIVVAELMHSAPRTAAA